MRGTWLGTPPDYDSVDLFGPSSLYDAYTPSEDDYFDVLHFFMRWVPAEIADIFLHAAQYWPRVKVRRMEQVSVVASLFADVEPDLKYLYSMPIPKARRVERVRICTDSSDQGWTSDPEPTGNVLFSNLSDAYAVC
jgi:hypothetical protein